MARGNNKTVTLQKVDVQLWIVRGAKKWWWWAWRVRHIQQHTAARIPSMDMEERKRDAKGRMCDESTHFFWFCITGLFRLFAMHLSLDKRVDAMKFTACTQRIRRHGSNMCEDVYMTILKTLIPDLLAFVGLLTYNVSCIPTIERIAEAKIHRFMRGIGFSINTTCHFHFSC